MKYAVKKDCGVISQVAEMEMVVFRELNTVCGMVCSGGLRGERGERWERETKKRLHVSRSLRRNTSVFTHSL